MLKIQQLRQNLWTMDIEKDILCPESLFKHVCQLLSPYFHFSNDRKTKVCCSNDRNYTRTNIFAPSAQEWLSWCDSGLWGWVACTLDSLGCRQSDAWQELAPAATNLYERNSELLPSRYFEACHHWRKGLMLRFYSLLFTCPGRCGLCFSHFATLASFVFSVWNFFSQYNTILIKILYF